VTASSNPVIKTGATRLIEDTRRHFLAEIVARVPVDRLVEVHLFTPIRQGGVETGVAVVTARRIEPLVESADVPIADTPISAALTTELPTDDVPPPDAAVAAEMVDDAVPADAVAAEASLVDEPTGTMLDGLACDPTEAASLTPADGETLEEPVASTELAAVDVPSDDTAADGDAPSEAPDDVDPESATERQPEAGERHTVFTARYRLTIKGPERGRWDADVVEEADAPLVTVDAVVRGVQRRAGDAAEADRLDAEAVSRILALGASPA
jgi:hypothetical protein